MEIWPSIVIHHITTLNIIRMLRFNYWPRENGAMNVRSRRLYRICIKNSSKAIRVSIHGQKESYTDRDDDEICFSGELFAPPNSVMYSILPWSSGDLDRDDDERERLRLPGGLQMKGINISIYIEKVATATNNPTSLVL